MSYFNKIEVVDNDGTNRTIYSKPAEIVVKRPLLKVADGLLQNNLCCDPGLGFFTSASIGKAAIYIKELLDCFDAKASYQEIVDAVKAASDLLSDSLLSDSEFVIEYITTEGDN